MRDRGIPILIVDGDANVRSMLAWLLGDEYCCFAAKSAEEAKEMLPSSSFTAPMTVIALIRPTELAQLNI